ncbi:NAD(P)/FAD-dependent oxidoreductase [Gallaecimonas xiamenensis]|uniref:FAD-dependent pyridine nucleotide-disulfide oxidoreductase n=1 Tax=Gallaecimonas xiamenensis 3-C-1 TaxID=745411 RepID=K2J6G7_9GAMM|nr:FAD-dependent oxidoreductase [Gallaecimonas xiamenensis]EKE70628.1 FAD-dependent pyridine nucleotide-disulfide oxidoreductase [Gallaecimonas xiamenensis 3-C-1]
MKKRILIIGSGFAGMWSALSATRLLDQHNRDDVDVTVLAPQAELRVRPRFYEQQVHRMVAPLAELFDAVGVTFIKGFAKEIDVAAKAVRYQDQAGEVTSLAYDKLVLASGSKVIRPALPGMNHVFDVDELDQAVRLETHIQALGEQPESLARNTVVVAGGGFTGIETAAEMPERLRAALGADAKTRVIIIDKATEIAAALGQGPRGAIVDASEELGLEWLLGRTVASADADGVTLDNGERIDAKTVIWTVGVRADALTEQIPAERDNFGRLHVDDNLKVLGLDDVFATGDTAYAKTDDAGNHALMSCQHAIALGRASGNNAAASLLEVAPHPYRQEMYVTCLDLGAWGAMYSEGWDREVKMVKDEAKQLKSQINSVWIYPPAADRAQALAAADPSIPVVA